MSHSTATPAAPASFAVYRATKDFAGLNVLRALAILAVVWHHTVGDDCNGVTVFFTISGFLIVTLLLREKDKRGTVSLRDFYMKRALRILPLYYLVLAIYLVLTYAFEANVDARAGFFAHLGHFATFTTNWVLSSSDTQRIIFYFSWSLAAEQQFYLVWPWIEQRARGALAMSTAAVCVALSPDFSALVLGPTETSGPLLVVSRFPAAIGLGVLLAHALHRPRAFAWIAAVLGRRGSAALAAMLLIAVLAVRHRLGVLEDPLIDLLVAALVAAMVIRPDHDFASLARLQPLIGLGIVSYGVFLSHMLAAHAVRKIADLAGIDSGLLLFAGTAVVATAVASLSYHTFERWFRDLKDRALAPSASSPLRGVAESRRRFG